MRERSTRCWGSASRTPSTRVGRRALDDAALGDSHSLVAAARGTVASSSPGPGADEPRRSLAACCTASHGLRAYALPVCVMVLKGRLWGRFSPCGAGSASALERKYTRYGVGARFVGSALFSARATRGSSRMVVERAASNSSLIEVLDRVLDKGIVISFDPRR